MKRKGFIFDLDGVIVNTSKYHFLTWKKLANSFNVDFTKIQNEQLKGVSRIKSLEKILEWGNKTISKQEFNELMKKKNDDYLKYIDNIDMQEVLTDVPKILDYLTKKKQGIALGSASKNARIILKKIELINKFEAIVDGNDVIKGKPHPEVFLTAAKKLQIKANECIVFEDSVAGIKAANTANMISIGIGDKEVLHEADYVFNNFIEIEIDFIKKIINE